MKIGDPFIRVVIDYDKCTCCGLCVEGCCGYAIEMVDDDVDIEEYNNSVTAPEGKSTSFSNIKVVKNYNSLKTQRKYP